MRTRRGRMTGPGFSLVELLVCVLIVLVLVSVLLPGLGGVFGVGRRLVCESNLRQLAVCCVQYADEHGEMPLEMHQVGAGAGCWVCPADLRGGSVSYDLVTPYWFVSDDLRDSYQLSGAAGLRNYEAFPWLPIIGERPGNHGQRVFRVGYDGLVR